MQFGFFDIERHQQLNKLKDPLLVLSSLIDFEMFRHEIDKCFEKERKDNSGRKPFGKVYVTDFTSSIQTELQLNFKNKGKKTLPVAEPIEDFVITKEMIKRDY